MAAISLRGLTKVYGNGVTTLDALDLEIGDGEFLVLVGPSGCGKTTALRMVAGLEDDPTGKVMIGGRVVNDIDAEGPGHRDGVPELRALPAHDACPTTSGSR